VFEHLSQQPLSRRAFARRMARQGMYAAELASISIAIGMAGYHWLGGFSWVDSFLNASMLLGGMGPIGDLTNTPAKIFAGLFALYAGLVFLVVTALMLAPIFHRILHRFHWEQSQRNTT